MVIVALNHGERGLVQIAESQQFVSLRANVAELEGHLAGDLLLQVQVVIFHVRRAQILVHAETVGHVVGEAKGRKAWTERGCKRVSDKDRIRCPYSAGVRRSWVVKTIKRQMPLEHILRIRVIEDAESRANNGLLVAGNIPGNTNARSDVFVIRLV